MKSKIMKVIISIVIVVGLLYLLQLLLMPKYMSGVIEGAMVSEYYDEVKDHDVIFIGDCELYENFSPVDLWREYGINSFIRGGAQQLIWHSYYLLEETLEYEKPDVVVFNVLSMKYDVPQKETYNRMAIDGMKWSSSKINNIKASMTEEEEFLDYVFPILRYHSRWNQLTSEDFKYLFTKDKVTHNGYYMRVDVMPLKTIPEPKPLTDYQLGENSYKYLDMMRELCEKEGVELVLVKAPTLYPHWYKEWDEQIVEYADTYGLDYYNFVNEIGEIGIDFNLDTYDGGLHLNLSGAKKMTSYFGKILQDEYGIENRSDEEKLSNRWEEKLQLYNKEIERQNAEL